MLEQRSIFALYPLPLLPTNLILIPRGLTYEVVKKERIPSENDYSNSISKRFRGVVIPVRDKLALSEQNLITPDITHFYSNAFVAIGQFFLEQYDSRKNAEKYFTLAVSVDSENALAYSNLGNVAFMLGDCPAAKKNLANAIYYYPLYRAFYWKLYEIETTCKIPKDNLAKQYHYYFHKDMQKDMKAATKKS